MSVIPLRINLQGPDAEYMAITQCAQFIRRRIVEMNAAETWVSCGEHLAILKKNLLKESNRGDNEHIGWKKAFELEPRQFPFGRRHADKLIELHKFFSGHAWPLKKLPASFEALHLISKSKLPMKTIENHISDGLISTGSTKSEIAALLPKKKRRDPKSAPRSRRIAAVIAFMNRLGISKKDLPDG